MVIVAENTWFFYVTKKNKILHFLQSVSGNSIPSCDSRGCLCSVVDLGHVKCIMVMLERRGGDKQSVAGGDEVEM